MINCLQRAMIRKIILISVLCFAFMGMHAQSKLSPYTYKYLHAQKTMSMKDAQRMQGNEYVSAYIYLNKGADMAILEETGVRINLVLDNIVTAQLPANRIEEIAALEEVKYVQIATPVRPMMDKARLSAGVNKVQDGIELPQAFAGKDVVVGVIDAGFQYGHINFYDRDRQKLRVQRVWEQNYDKGTPPEGFTYGGEFKTVEELLKAAGDVTTNSHGSHVAGIAAGADRLEGNTYYGVAGDADIVFVSMGDRTENNVNLSDAIAYIYKYAESVDKPCVINMSLGTQAGPHDGTSTFDLVADRLQGKGRLLVGSVGNFGAGKFHVSKTFSSISDEPLKTFVKFKTSRTVTGDIEIWGEPGMKYDVEVIVYNTYRKEQVDASGKISAGAKEGASQEYEFQNSAKGSVLVTTEISPLNGKTHALVSLNVSALKQNNNIGIILTPQSEGTLHVWGDDVNVELTSAEVEGWTEGNNEYSLAEIGGTGTNIISVGAYVTRNTYTKEGSDEEVTLDETMNDIASFSSRGPAIDGRVKPEITAPGTYIASSISAYDQTISSQVLARTETWNDQTFYYAYMQGTSMAAPFVAGVLATWLQANPELSPADVRTILKKTAQTDSYTGTLPPEGNGIWGYGKIDAWNGIKKSLEWAASVDAMPEMLPAAVLTGSGKDDCRILFTKESTDVHLSVYSMGGNRVYTQSVGTVHVSEEIPVDLHDVPAGIYLVSVKGNRINRMFKVCISK